MKHLVLIAASLLMAAPAFATKARMAAFQTTQSSNLSPHIKDAQTSFDNPSDLLLLPDYVTLEAGVTSQSLATVTSPTAEGGFALTAGDAKWGVYLGRRSTFTNLMRLAFGFQTQENPVEIQYARNADIKWGIGFNYSEGKKDAAAAAGKQKNQAMGLRLGVNADNYDGYVIVGLGSTATGNSAGNLTSLDGTITNSAVAASGNGAIAQDGDGKYTGLVGLKFGGNWKADMTDYFFDYYMDGMKYESTVNANASGTKVEQYQATLGALERMKADGGEWYYGAALRMNSFKRSASTSATLLLKQEIMSLPFFVGFESAVNSWLTLRGSLVQNILYGTKKLSTDPTATTAIDGTDSVGSNTTAAAGVGLMFGKMNVDASLEGLSGTAAGGKINTTTLLATLGMTYNF
jgi:hypothetical protein